MPIEPAAQKSLYAPASAAIYSLLCIAICLRVCFLDYAIALNCLDRLLLVDLHGRVVISMYTS